ncbi:nucleoside phosphorylase [Streptomyces albus]|uniref:nucleoside phosphorylase n=1 Tax=Streptomyces albus TaxID=1888 RepID=UPI003701E379
MRARCPEATLTGTGGAILLYQQRLLDHACSRYRTQPRPGWVRRGQLHLTEYHGRRLALCGGFGLGAPAAALVLEQLIALGLPRVITVGTAASLQPDLNPGTTVVCDSALRDEGVSHHYLPPAARITAPGKLTSLLLRQAPHLQRGATWTTDAPYRETAAEVTRYRAAGVLTADMEAAAVFAVARHRSIPAGVLLAVADSLTERTVRQDEPATTTALRTALDTALAALSKATGEVNSGLR